MMFDQKAYSRAWYLANRDKTRQRARSWYETNRELCIERATERNNTNRESRLATTRRFYERHKERWAKWRSDNPEKASANSRVYVQNRRARLAKAQGRFTLDAWLEKVAYHGWRCVYCKRPLTAKTLTIDHRKPLSRKGSNWLANLAPACRGCNARKFTHASNF